MAELEQAEGFSVEQKRGQLAAIAWLRWRIFLNNFRSANKKRSTTGLVFLILLRVVAWSVISCFFLGPIVGAGLLGFFGIGHHHAGLVSALTWGIFLISVFVSINIAPTALGFDLTPLLRFPLGFGQYLLVRLFFGLFAIPAVVANLSLAAAAIGIGISRPTLFPWAALVLGVFALHNVFFIRMVFAWVDRWLATRRAREIFGGLVLAVSLGFQLVASGNWLRHGSKLFPMLRLLAPLGPVGDYLPPGLAARSILDFQAGNVPAAGVSLLGLVAYALVFLQVFSLRLRREFRGENLSEAAGRAQRVMPRRAVVAAATSPAAKAGGGWVPKLPSTIGACLEKEWIYLKRSGAQLYGLFTPLFFVFILARRHNPFGSAAMLLPYAVTYTLFGLLANLYNVLGADAAGMSFYLLAPIRLRDVVLTKNFVSVVLIGTEILLTCVVVSLISGGVPPAAMVSATLTWAVFALLANLAVGNVRSVLAPKRFELGKARRPATARGTGIISFAVLFGTLLTGAPIIYLCRRFDTVWLATPIFLVLDVAGMVGYWVILNKVDGMVERRKEMLTEALCKV